MELCGLMMLTVFWTALFIQLPIRGVGVDEDISHILNLNLTGEETLAIAVDIRGGVPPKIDDELQASAKQSIAWAYGWDVEDLNSNFALSRDEHRIIAKAFDDRKVAKDESVARARARLKQHEKMTVEMFKDIKLRYSKEESQAEAKLLHVLNELFPPSKLQELLLCTIARKQYDFGRIEFIQRELKLEDSQVRIFAELPAFLLSQAFEQRKRLGVSKFDPALAAAAKARIDAARNTLTTEQFEVYAKAVGLIPRDVALAKFLKTCSDEKRKELAVYKPCTKILEQAK